MTYTQQRRRAMNRAVKAMYPDINFYESPNGIPVMECEVLPQGARMIMEPGLLIDRINETCVRKNSVGETVPDYGKAYPVFIATKEYTGNRERNFYRVNYVSPSRGSIESAEQYISDGKLYAIL